MRSRRGLACFAVVALAAAAPPASAPFCPADFNGDAVVDLTDHAAFSDCFGGPDAPPTSGCTHDADFDDDGDVDMADFSVFQRIFGGGGVQAPLPVKTVTFDNIVIHDPESPEYDADCISCHGDKLNEVSLDCKTPTAHARMLDLFGLGNDRCLECHQVGTNFFNESAGDLRRQVVMEEVQCTLCHNDPGQPDTPKFYVRP